MATKCNTAAAPPPGPPPPFFSDIGKNARGLFARCYNMGTIGLTFRSAVPKSGVVFGSSISHNLKVNLRTDLNYVRHVSTLPCSLKNVEKAKKNVVLKDL